MKRENSRLISEKDASDERSKQLARPLLVTLLVTACLVATAVMTSPWRDQYISPVTQLMTTEQKVAMMFYQGSIAPNMGFLLLNAYGVFNKHLDIDEDIDWDRLVAMGLYAATGDGLSIQEKAYLVADLAGKTTIYTEDPARLDRIIAFVTEAKSMREVQDKYGDFDCDVCSYAQKVIVFYWALSVMKSDDLVNLVSKVEEARAEQVLNELGLSHSICDFIQAYENERELMYVFDALFQEESDDTIYADCESE